MVDAGPDSAADELERLAGSLRAELLELDVDAVEHATRGPAPDWTRAIEALAILLRVPRARLQAGGVLVGVGLLLALHLVGVLVQHGRDDGSWGLGSARYTQSCRPGRGHEDFTPELCV